jgi:cell division protein FtsN
MTLKNITLIAATMLLVSCASWRKGSTSFSSVDDVYSNTTKPKVVAKTDPKPKVVVKTPEPKIVVKPEPVAESKPQPTIMVREERVETIENEGPDFNYYVIIGSFQSLENAHSFRTQLITQGFVPVILKSEIGFYRVSVAAYNDEMATRERIRQIRQQYEQYNDVWLLKKMK